LSINYAVFARRHRVYVLILMISPAYKILILTRVEAYTMRALER